MAGEFFDDLEEIVLTATLSFEQLWLMKRTGPNSIWLFFERI